MRTLLSLSLLLTVLAGASPLTAAETPATGPEAGLRVPLLDMGQADVIDRMTKKGNYAGGT